MAAAVPFALVAVVQLLALAAALGLAAAAAATTRQPAARVALVAGGLLLATAHGLTGATLGHAASDPYAYLRAAGYLCIGLGAAGFPAGATVAGAAAVVPLGARGQAAYLAASVAAFASVVPALRLGRSREARLLGAWLSLSALTEALGPGARTSGGAAVALLAVRGLASLLALALVVRLVRTSLLGKVVAAILAGVLGLALGTALVVGQVATSALGRDSERRLADTGKGQIDAFLDEKQQSLTNAKVLATCPTSSEACSQPFTATASRSVIVGFAGRSGVGSFTGLVDPLARAALAHSRAVREVLTATDGRGVATLDLVIGARPLVVELGAAPVYPAGVTRGRPVTAAVYAVLVDASRMRQIQQTTGLQATLYVPDGGGLRRVATTLPAAKAALIDREASRRSIGSALRDGTGTEPGVTVGAEGQRPGVRFQALVSGNGQLVGVLALSADSNVILATQRQVLVALFVSTVLVALLVGVLALLLGRRIVRPVSQLTLAATRVQGGDLGVRTGVDTGDELGVLARTFDAMTTSLAESSESLQLAATQEAALRGRLEAVLDSMGDGLVATDARHRVTAVNPAGLDLLGLPDATSLLGRPLREVVAGTDTAGHDLLPRIDGGRAERVGTLARTGGGTVAVSLAVTPLRDGAGHVVVLRDMRREAEIERMKTEFLSNVSHELRTPLTPIRGYAEMLRRHPNLPPDKTATYANSILESSLRMSRVVDLLVDVAALEAGRVEAAREPVAVPEFLDARVDAWREREPGREIRRRVQAGLPLVDIDPLWVAKAYDELVDNAVKYSGKAVTLAATLTDDRRRVRLTVRDAGAGIPDDRRAALFTPFEQADGSATRAVGGLGLGLSFVRRVADDFGLDVVVESTLGKGSAFSLEVPVVPGSTRRATPRRAAPVRPGRRR